MILQTLGGNPDARAPRQQSVAVGRYEMRHRATQPDVTVQPEPTVHRENHSIASLLKLTPLEHQRGGITRWWNGRHPKRRFPAQRQLTTPSGSPAYGGVTLPEYTEHVSGNDCGCVTFADQPLTDALIIVNTTPGDDECLSSDSSEV